MGCLPSSICSNSIRGAAHEEMSGNSFGRVIKISEAWQGLPNLKHLVILWVELQGLVQLCVVSLTGTHYSGDSYSAVGYDASCPNPTPKEPLGIAFPGRTWCESGSLFLADVPCLINDRIKWQAWPIGLDIWCKVGDQKQVVKIYLYTIMQ
jgi:hypothetical protein